MRYTMKTEFNNLEQLLNRKEEIENELHKITNFFFPTAIDLFNLVKHNLIESEDFEKAFNLMAEKNQIEIVFKKYLNDILPR